MRFGGLTALEDVDLSLAPGELLGLIGPNGAGKTTFVNVLTGFQRADAGSVRLGEQDVTGWPADRIGRAGVARTFQAVRLFGGLSVQENVELAAVAAGWPRAEARQRAGELLAWLGLDRHAAARADSLPYGEERRIGIARALAGRLRFLLLDEPAAGLNESEADELVETIACIPERFGCGVLVIEHNMRLIMALCRRIQVLEQGRTIAIGTPAEVRADAAVRRAYLGVDAGAAPSARPGIASDAEEVLAIDDLSVRYGSVAALRGIGIEVREGEFVGVIGPNGAGKSTLLAAIAGIVAPSHGAIRYRGRPLAGQSLEDRVNGGISLVPEGRHVFPALTVRENLAIGGTPRGDRAALARDIDEMCERFAVLKERLGAPAGKLSGGEQQQLVIARALLAKPRLLMIDEPSLGLAPLMVDSVYEALHELRDLGTTVLLVEQNAARALEIADRIYVLASGLIRLSGAAQELRADPTFDSAYFGLGDEAA